MVEQMFASAGLFFFFFHFHFTCQNKKWKTTIACVKEEKSAAPGIHPYCLILQCLVQSCSVTNISTEFWLSQPSNDTVEYTVSPAQPPSLWMAGISKPKSRSVWFLPEKLLQIFCYFDFFLISCRFNEIWKKTPLNQNSVLNFKTNQSR